jgi:hypothetical protein
MTFIRQYLPSRYGVGTGIIINSTSDEGDSTFDVYENGKDVETCQTSRETDIVITDCYQHAPLAAEEAFHVYPVEMVVAVIEVTRDLSKSKLAEDCHKIAVIRSLAKTRHYADEDGFEDDSKMPLPRGYVVGFSGALKKDEAEATIKSIKDDFRPNAILKMGECLLYRRPEAVTLSEFTENPLFRFLTMLRYHLDVYPKRPVDLKHYLPELSEDYPLEDEELEDVSGT